ncbi:MAG: hypothetical protein KJZ86_20085 [Caldilineaceae bacterium]|nr:hypothetical protein [Caldilineaceae bacterium]HRJ44828.1 hypothetical protein [Caldilineaceae bacterium]
MDISIAFGDRIVSIPDSIFLAILCLLLFLRYRRQVLADRGRWEATRRPVPPSLTAGPSAFDVMYTGSSGCFWSFAGALVMFFIAMFGLDLLLAEGAYTRDILYVLFSG